MNTEENDLGLLSRLSLAASQDIEQYYAAYFKEFKAARQLRARPNSQQASISEVDFSRDPDILRFSLVFNDSTFLTIPIGKTMILVMPYTQRALRELLAQEQLSFVIETSFLEKLGVTEDQISSSVTPSFSRKLV